MFDNLWIFTTVIASGSQTLRNVMQRDLIAVVGTVGATHVRFLYGLPFGFLFFLAISAVSEPLPGVPSASFFGWTALGAVAQIVATGLMLSAMRSKSFLVTIAYTKSEPVLVALFGILFLHEIPTPLLLAAIVVATLGVMIMSWPKAASAEQALSLKPAVMGVIAGGLFGLAAVGFKGGINALGAPSFLLGATTTLFASLVIQTGLLTVYLVATDLPALMKLLRAWKPSLVAGFLGAFASQLWFFSFAIAPVASVRTLGLVEILFSLAVSRKLLQQMTSPREAIGIALLILGVLGVLNA